MPLLLLPYLTNKLGVQGFAELSIVLAAATYVLVAIGLGADRFVLKFVADGISRGRLVSAALKWFWLSSFILSVIGFFLYGVEGVIVVVYALSQASLMLMLSALQSKEEVGKYSGVQVGVSITSTVMTIIIFEYVSFGVNERLLIVAMSNSIFSLFLWSYVNSESDIEETFMIEKGGFFAFIAYSMPLVGYLLSSASKGQLEKIYFSYSASDEYIASYSLAFQLMTLYLYFYTSVNKALVPKLYSRLRNEGIDGRYFVKQLMIKFLLSCVIVLPVFFLPDFIFTLIFGDEFHSVSELFLFFSISTVLYLPYLMLLNTLLYFSKVYETSVYALAGVFVYFISLYFLHRYYPILVPLANLVSTFFVIVLMGYKVFCIERDIRNV